MVLCDDIAVTEVDGWYDPAFDEWVCHCVYCDVEFCVPKPGEGICSHCAMPYNVTEIAMPDEIKSRYESMALIYTKRIPTEPKPKKARKPRSTNKPAINGTGLFQKGHDKNEN